MRRTSCPFGRAQAPVSAADGACARLAQARVVTAPIRQLQRLNATSPFKPSQAALSGSGRQTPKFKQIRLPTSYSGPQGPIWVSHSLGPGMSQGRICFRVCRQIEKRVGSSCRVGSCTQTRGRPYEPGQRPGNRSATDSGEGYLKVACLPDPKKGTDPLLARETAYPLSRPRDQSSLTILDEVSTLFTLIRTK